MELTLYAKKDEKNLLFVSAIEGRKEMFYLTTHSTFYLRLYGVGHMVKDHSDSERGNTLPPHRLLFPISSRVLLYAPSHRQDSTYHGLCYTSNGTIQQLTFYNKSNMNEEKLNYFMKKKKKIISI